jgi:MarR family transcriptional regulator, transcriptional regulator for hemolysin
MLMNYLSEIVRCGNLFMGRRLKGQDSGCTEQYILMYLISHTDINQESIADYFTLDKGTVAKTLTKMERKGLVSRLENPLNHREKLVSLTAEGVTKIQGMRKLKEEWEAAIYQDMTPEEIKTINNLLQKLAVNAKNAIIGSD